MAPDTGRRDLTADTKVRLLLDVSQRVRGVLDLDEILNRLLDTLRSFVGFDAAGIFVLEKDLVRPRNVLPGQVIAGVARVGYNGGAPGRDPMLFHGAGITGHVIRTGRPHVTADVRNDPHYVVGRETTCSELAVPILRDGRAIGALNLECDRRDAFGDRELEVLTFFAEAAGIAIENAMRHERMIEAERSEAQLRLAQEVQARLLPVRAPEVPGYAMAGLCLPTLRIGGDYFDYIPLPDGRLALAIADVAGKGAAAALVMAAFRALVRSHVAMGCDLARVAESVNRQLPESLAGAVFVTAVLGVLDPATGRLEYLNCGHNPPFVMRPDGTAEWLDQGGTVLGVFPDARYDVGETRIAEGDLLLFYTDGVVESADQARTHFGAERLAAVTARLRHLPPARLLQEIVLLTREFSGAVEFDDDFTLLAVGRDTAGASS